MKLILVLLLVISLLQLVTADIFCNPNGHCSGSGKGAADTRCNGCHSCRYKNCCHVRFTNPYTVCDIPGWRSKEYKNIHHGK